MLPLLLVLAAALAPQERPKPFEMRPPARQQALWTLAGSLRVWEAGSDPDLTLYRDRWYVAFEQEAAVRILSSADLKLWETVARIGEPGNGLRSPRLTVLRGNELMLTAVQGAGTLAWLSRQGRDWDAVGEVSEPGVHLWQMFGQRNLVYALGSGTGLGLFVSRDGGQYFEALGGMGRRAEPGGAAFLILPDNRALCLAGAQLGESRPAYRNWTWRDAGVALGAPSLIQIPDGRLVASGAAALFLLEVETARLEKMLELPAASRIAMVWRDDVLHAAYASAQPGLEGIYVARVAVPVQ